MQGIILSSEGAIPMECDERPLWLSNTLAPPRRGLPSPSPRPFHPTLLNLCFSWRGGVCLLTIEGRLPLVFC